MIRDFINTEDYKVSGLSGYYESVTKDEYRDTLSRTILDYQLELLLLLWNQFHKEDI
jgi:hypothetical protein